MLVLAACMLAFALDFMLLFAFACALPFVVIVTLALVTVTLALLTLAFIALVFAAVLVFAAILVLEAFAFVAFMLPLPLSAGEQAVQKAATARRVRSAKVLRI